MANTNPSPATRFKKGDPRINKKGRPKTFDALRELAQQISHETALKDKEPIVIDGHKVTVAEAILRQWAQSKNPMLQRQFVEVAFGKVPDEVKVSGDLGVTHKGYVTISPDEWPDASDKDSAKGD